MIIQAVLHDGQILSARLFLNRINFLLTEAESLAIRRLRVKQASRRYFQDPSAALNRQLLYAVLGWGQKNWIQECRTGLR